MGDKPGHPFRGNQYTVASKRLTHTVTSHHGGSMLRVESVLTNPNWLEAADPAAAEMVVHIDKANHTATGRVDARRQGKGYGAETFETVMRELGKHGVKTYQAYVEHANLASHRMVTKAGGKVVKEGPHGKTYHVPVPGYWPPPKKV